MTKQKESWEKEFEKQFMREGRLRGVIRTPTRIKSFIRSLLSQERQRVLEKYKDALIWCSGSQDFQEDGVARKGWLKICKPLLQTLKEEK